MRTLEKNRERRYDSATALADDVLRALNHEAVEARPPSLVYKFSKYARRHRSFLVASTTVFLTLVVGLSIATWQAIRANHLLERAAVAEDNWKESARRANKAEKIAKEEAKAASENEEAVSSVIDFLVNELISHANPYVHQNQQLTVRQLLEKISKSPSTKFPSQPRAEASVRHFLGVICHRAGMIEQAQQHLSRALELRIEEFGEDHVETARTKFAFAYSLLDFRTRYQSTEVLSQISKRRRQLANDAVETFEKVLGPNAPETLHALALKAFVAGYGRQKLNEAEQLYRELVSRAPNGLKSNSDDPLDLLGAVYMLIHLDQVGHDVKVDKEIKVRFEMAREELPNDHPQRAYWTHWYGQSLYLKGKVKESAPYLQESFEARKRVLGKDNYFTFLSGRSIAALFARQGEFDKSISQLEECLEQVPEHAGQTLNLGILYLKRNRAGDRKKWLSKTKELYSRYKDSDNFATLNNLLKLTMVSNARSSEEKLVQKDVIELASNYRTSLQRKLGHDLVDFPIPKSIGHAYVQQNTQLAIALAEFRSGNFESAKELFVKVENGPLLMIRAIAFAAHASISVHENDFESAKKWLEQAQLAAKNTNPAELHIHRCFAWSREYMYEVMLKEANELLMNATENR